MILKARKAYKFIIQRDTPFWMGSFWGLLFITGVAFIGMSLGMPTGLGIWFDMPVITAVVLILVSIGCIAAAGILAVVRIPLPRLFVGGLICIYLTLSFSLTEFNMNYFGAAFITAILLVIGFLLGSSMTLIIRNKGYMWFRYSYAFLSVFILIYGLAWLLSPGKEVYSSIQPQDSSYTPSLTERVDDPSQEGIFDIYAFTYGTGEDLHREEFATEVDYITDPVDASDFLAEWHILRKIYWGFDQQEIPLKGRVWMPEGEGSFPLVLIVHGSSKMENHSDEGYDYLGELLASRGFIAVSVGQNFINYSVWSEGIDWDMTTRAWVLLQHLIMIEEASDTEGTPFFEKVDMDNIGLVGHSRGGQAAALAANFKQFYNENNHKEISLDYDFSIKAIAAIAPTDRTIEKKFIRLDHLNYFVIQGSQDSDVNTFYGDRQYRRTRLNGDDYRFKASLYVEGANHGQFNTVWGNKDTTMPTALLLNKEEMMNGEEQRQIAKVYISAFLEASLKDNKQYLSILRDYRTALQWLPDTTYLNRFEDSNFIKISDYEEDRNLQTTGIRGGQFTGEFLSIWEEQDVKNRMDFSTSNHAALIAWDGRYPGRYTLELPEEFAEENRLDMDSSLVFSLANADITRTRPYNQVPKITIEMVTLEGVSVHYPLSDFRSYPPIIHSRFTKLGVFEKSIKLGNLGNSSEPIFQIYEIPLSDFAAQDEAFDLSQVYKIQFNFDQGPPGKVFFDDIGFSM